MTREVRHREGYRHPWSAEPGWDQLYMTADSVEELQAMINSAKGKNWQEWARDNRQFAGVMYRPTDHGGREWRDDAEQYRGTPRGHGSGFEIGDTVYTDWTGNITRHEISAIRTGQMSQTGLTFQVQPPIRGTAYLKDDPGGAPREYAGWIDSAWFRREDQW